MKAEPSVGHDVRSLRSVCRSSGAPSLALPLWQLNALHILADCEENLERS